MYRVLEGLVRSNKIKLGACAAFVFAGACASQAMMRKPALEKAPASFFRVTADYTVIDTGEEIKFDFVVGCGGIISHYSYTTPSVIFEAHPTMQYIATKDGSAVGIKSPGALCDPSYFEFVPDDFRPFMMWFPEVQDMSFAWGYATIRAYESPNAAVVFNGATVSPATEKEWAENRAQLADEYEQIGAMPGPWGHSFSRSPSEVIIGTYLVGDKMGLAASCQGYTRLELNPELTEEIFASAPQGTGRYWIVDDAAWDPIEGRLRRSGKIFNGRRFQDFYKTSQGTVQEEEGGTISTNFAYDALGEVYPILPIRQSMEAIGIDLATPPDEYFRTVLVDPDWDGFSACWSGGDPITVPGSKFPSFDREEFVAANIEVGRSQPYDPRGRQKPYRIEFNEAPIGQITNRQPSVQMPRIVDRNGFVYVNVGWGIHNIS